MSDVLIWIVIIGALIVAIAMFFARGSKSQNTAVDSMVSKPMTWEIATQKIAENVTLSRRGRLIASGDGDYLFDIVGEASYQDALAAIAGPKKREGVETEKTAVLLCESNNRFDVNAVSVQIEGRTVGYLSRADAQTWRQALKEIGQPGADVSVDAMIVGGWVGGRQGEGHYGVKLDLTYPFDFFRAS